MNVNRRLITKKEEKLSFDRVSAEYCSQLYSKETRLQRTRKFLREELDPRWTGTFDELVVLINRHIFNERLSVSGDDLRQVLAEEGVSD
jgi:hypothetical protein